MMSFLIIYYALWLILLLIILANFYIEISLESPAVIFWISLIAVFLIPSLFDPFNDRSNVLGGPSTNLINNIILIKSLGFSIIFCVFYYVVRISLMNREKSYIKKTRIFAVYVSEGETKRSLLFFVFMLLLGLLLLIASIVTTIGLAGFLKGTYGSFRLEANNSLKIASYFIILAFSGSLFVTILSRNWKFFAIILLVAVLTFLAGRTRQLMVPVAIGFFYYVVFRYKGVKMWLSIFALSLIGLVALLFLQFFRYQGGLSESVSAVITPDFYFSFYKSLLEAEGEAAVRHYFYYLLRPDTEFDGLHEATSYLRLALIFIPGTLLKVIGIGDIKPVDMSTLIYQDYFGEGLTIVATAHPLIFGDAYANLSWMGVLFGGIVALLSSASNIFIRYFPWAWRIPIISYFGYIFVMLARGGVYNSITGAIYVCLFYMVSYNIYRRFLICRPS